MMRYPPGRYVCLYDGHPPHLKEDAQVVEASPGRIIFEVATPSSAGICLSTTGPTRNPHVYHEANESLYNSGEIFNPSALEKIKSLKPKCIRAVGLMKVNGGNTQVHWENRPQVADVFWGTSKGVPLEVIIQLCNRLEVDLWLTLPHGWLYKTADQAARLIKRKLNPERNVIVEVSCEIWNNDGAYRAQRDYMWNQGQKLWPDSPLPIHEKGWQFYGVKTAKMGGYFKSVLGKDRVKVVVCGQSSNSYLMEQMLGTPLWTDRAGNHIDAVGTAPYIEMRASSLDADTFYDNEFPAAITEAMKGVKAHKAVADKYGVPLWAYEGGTSLLSDDQVTRDFFSKVSRDPRMTPALLDYFAQWKANGGDLFCYLGCIKGPNRYGDWGIWYNAIEKGDTAKSLAIKQTDVPMGVNVSDPTWYGPESIFLDKVKMADGWVPQKPGTGWGGGSPVDVNIHGNLISVPVGESREFLMEREFPAVNKP